MDQLHHQLAAAPAPGEAVNNDGCKERLHFWCAASKHSGFRSCPCRRTAGSVFERLGNTPTTSLRSLCFAARCPEPSELRFYSPIPCKQIKPITVKSGCQLNSRSPPSQPKPSLKWRTHLSTKTIDTVPAAAADPSANSSFFHSSIASSVHPKTRSSVCNCSSRKEAKFPSADWKLWRADRGHMTQGKPSFCKRWLKLRKSRTGPPSTT